MGQANQLETDITKKIMNHLKSRPYCWAFKTHGGIMQAAGIPDVIACFKGRFVGLEVKRPGNKPTLLQKVTLDLINKAGGTGAVVYSLEDAIRILEKIDNKEE